jgi:hypothetical protein
MHAPTIIVSSRYAIINFLNESNRKDLLSVLVASPLFTLPLGLGLYKARTEASLIHPRAFGALESHSTRIG